MYFSLGTHPVHPKFRSQSSLTAIAVSISEGYIGYIEAQCDRGFGPFFHTDVYSKQNGCGRVFVNGLSCYS